jgi:hypothetical protein
MVEVALAIGMGDNVETLTAIEEAQGYAHLMQLRGWDQRQLAAHLGRSQAHVVQRLALVNLPAKARAALEAGKLAARTAYYIASIPGEKARAEAADGILHSEIHGGVMPEGAALNYIRDHICRPLRSTPFDPKDAALVPEAGACSTCRFRAGNNAEEYGEVFDVRRGGVDRCMHPSCFEQKVAAHRARMLEKYATGGRIALDSDENARVFPREEHGIHYASDYVDYSAKPTPDILKKEVSPQTAPTWRELAPAGTVTVYVGVDQEGRVVDLVKRDEAIAAADLSEQKIFCESELKRAPASKPSKSTPSAAQSPSRASEEKAEKTAREKAEKARRKRERLSAEWLEVLGGVLESSATGSPAVWHRLPYWTLVYEIAVGQLSDEELSFVLQLVDPDGDSDKSPRVRLAAYAAEVRLPVFVSLCTYLLIAPRLLAEGPEGPTALAWHQDIILASSVEVPAAPPAPESPSVDAAPAPDWPQTLAQATVLPADRLSEEIAPELTEKFGDWYEEIFIGVDEDTQEPSLLDPDQSASVITVIVAEEDRALVDAFGYWLGTGPRLRLPGADWAAAQLSAAVAAAKKKKR